MKLGLKHLSPYLSYDIEALINIFGDSETRVKIVGLDFEFVEVDGVRKTITEQFEFYQIKPILRPLSDLTKEIEVNGEKFVPIVMLANMVKQYSNWAVLQDCVCGNEFYRFKYDSNGAFYLKDSFYRQVTNQLELFQKLFEWHFDVFQLIPQKLAIDINTIK